MAVANIKAPRKTKAKPRSVKAVDMGHVGYLPDWKLVENWESDNFHTALSDALRHYGYFYSLKDLKPKVVEWMVLRGYDKASIKAFKKSLDYRTPMTAGSLAGAYAAGMPLYPRAEEYLAEAVAKAISFGDEGTEEEDPTAKKKTVKQPSIQERITDKVNQHILHFEEAFEDGIIERGEKHPTPDVKSYVNTEAVPLSMVTRIIAHFQSQMDEIVESQSKKGDEQLIEAYAHLKKADVKRFTDFYKALIADLEMYHAQKKAVAAPRKRKAKPKSKVVANLKYLKSHDGLKLVSVNPESIIDAQTLWIYNTKTRKLGVYHAADLESLSVKSTTIIGFNTDKSIAKTLRKPAEQLAAFKKAGKVKLRTFMDEIKAVDIKMTGRLNADTIILKVQ